MAEPKLSESPQPATASALITAFAAIYIVWGSTYLGIRIVVETLPPFLMAAVRFFISGGILFLFLLGRGHPLPSAAQWRTNTVVGVLLLLGGNGLVSWAEQSVASGFTALIMATTPLWFVLLEWARPGGARPSLATALGIAIGFVGVGLLVGLHPEGAGAEPAYSGVGVLVLLVACLSWATGSTYLRLKGRSSSPWMNTALQMLSGSVALGVVALLAGEAGQFHWAAVSTRSWLALGYLIVFGSWVGFGAYVWLLKHTTAARASTYAYVNPVIAVFLGWAVLDEPLTARVGWAAAVIVLGVVIVQWPRPAAAPPRR